MTDRLSNIIKAHAASLDQSSGQIKFGTVVSVSPQAATARVVIQPEGVLSGWLPILSQWVGSGWGIACPPSPGDQVLVVPQEGNMEQGVIIGRTFSGQQPTPVAPAGEFWLVHRSGSFFKLCNDGTLQMNGDLHVKGDVYDQHGSLSALRGHYNSHIHHILPNGTTTTPSPTD